MGLHEPCLRAQDQGAKQVVGDRQDDVEILVHVAVVQEVVAVELAEPLWLFHPARLRQVHAPVNVFVKAVVSGKCKNPSGSEPPVSHQQ